MDFKSLNFKLAVLEQLLEEGYLSDEWQALKEQYYDDDNFDYEPIPQLLDFCAEVVLTEDMLEDVRLLVFDGGLNIYHDIIPNWDGEDNFFDVNDISDITRLPNLERFSVTSMLTTTDFSPLLEMESLRSVDWYELNKDTTFADQLRAKGVKVKA